MSQHSSLRFDPTRTKHRNVLKRHERIHRLQEAEKWNDRNSVFGLPKVKSLKIKMKKVKAEKATAEGAAAPAPGTAAPAATPSPAAPAAGAEKKKQAPATPKK
ncbi:MAG: small basic protein [Candidatus Omnitrophica bacterium]|nr:small basic protein [Candidatus Omnitrophota bacterium]